VCEKTLAVEFRFIDKQGQYRYPLGIIADKVIENILKTQILPRLKRICTNIVLNIINVYYRII